METQEHLVGLRCKESELKYQAGDARVHSDVHEHLMMVKRDHVEVVNSQGKAILVKISYDKLIDQDEIHLGKKDMEKLDLTNGDTVHLKVHRSIMDSIANFKEKILTRDKVEEKKEKKGDD